jgi:hypothetical protein
MEQSDCYEVCGDKFFKQAANMYSQDKIEIWVNVFVFGHGSKPPARRRRSDLFVFAIGNEIRELISNRAFCNSDWIRESGVFADLAVKG